MKMKKILKEFFFATCFGFHLAVSIPIYIISLIDLWRFPFNRATFFISLYFGLNTSISLIAMMYYYLTIGAKFKYNSNIVKNSIRDILS